MWQQILFVFAFIIYCECATQLTNNVVLTNQNNGVFWYKIPDSAGIPATITFSVFATSTSSSYLRECYEPDVSNSVFDNSCTGSACVFTLDFCSYSPGSKYFVQVAGGTGTFNISVVDQAVSVPVLSTLSTMSINLAGSRSIYKFSAPTSSNLYVVRVENFNGGSITGLNSGFISKEKDAQGTRTVCDRTSNFLISGFGLGFLSPSCPFASGTYYVVLSGNGNFNVSLQETSPTKTSVTSTLTSHTLAASSNAKFFGFDYTPTSTISNSVIFSTTSAEQAYVYSIGPGAFTSVTPNSPTCNVAIRCTLRNGNDCRYDYDKCGDAAGTYSFGVIHRTINDITFNVQSTSVALSSTSLSYDTDVNVASNNPITKFYRLPAPGSVDKILNFRINNTLSGRCRVYWSVGSPAIGRSCASSSLPRYDCNGGNDCYFSVPVCAITSTNQEIFMTLEFDRNQNDATARVSVGTSTISINQNTTINNGIDGLQVDHYTYTSPTKLYSVSFTSNAALETYETDGCLNDGSTRCTGFPCTYEKFCSASTSFSVQGRSSVVLGKNYSVTAISYPDFSSKSAFLSGTYTAQIPANSFFYVFFSTAADESIKLSFNNVNQLNFDLYDRQTCTNIARLNQGCNTCGDNFILLNDGLDLSNSGSYAIVIENTRGTTEPVTITLVKGSSTCMDVSNVISFCKFDNNNNALIGGPGRTYGFGTVSDAKDADDLAKITYDSLTTLSNGAICLNEMKRYICESAFRTCQGGGTFGGCITCKDALDSCGVNYCLFATCQTANNLIPCNGSGQLTSSFGITWLLIVSVLYLMV